MRFSVVVLCFLAVSVHMAVALQQPKEPLVIVGDLTTEERGNQPALDVNDWEDVQADNSHHGEHHGHGDGNNGGYGDGNHGDSNHGGSNHGGSNHGEWHEPNRHCPRKWPLAQKGPSQVSYEFKHHEIDPDLLDYPPTQYLEVEYRNLTHHCQPELGNELNICGTIHRPRLRWKCDPKKLHTIIFVDVNPYGLKHKKLGQFGILWLVVNVPGCRVSHGETIFQYQLPTPLYGAIGPTRYTILVYEQPAWKIDWSEEPKVPSTSFSYRFFRCINDLVCKYELTLIAGNFFYTQYDPCIEPYKAEISVPPYLEHARIASDAPPNPYA